jgi:prolyl oligopeptidase
MSRTTKEPLVRTYPPSPRGDVVDTYHGTAVPDPYRSLEADDAPDTLAWLDAQRALTESHLAGLPERDAFRRRLAELWDFARATPPERRGDWLFFQRHDGLQHQAVLYRQPIGGDREPEVVLDPNALSADGTTALVSTSLSDDGRYLAYNLAEGGSDWQVVRVLDVEQGVDLPDEVRWCKFTAAAWLPDGSGFYYARYPAPEEVPGAPPSTHQRVFLHRLGTSQDQDVLVYARPDAPDLGFHPIVSEDGAYLFLHVWEGSDERNRLYVREQRERADAPFVRLLDAHDAMYHLLGNDGPVLYLLTDAGAPNGRIVAIDAGRPGRDAWRELVPEGPAAIDSVTLVGDTFLVRRLHHAHHRLERYALDGTPAGAVPLPAAGAVGEPIGRRRDDRAFATFESFLHPPTVLEVDAASGAVSAFHRPTVAFDAGPYETRQVFVTSRDGARVPVFVTHARDLAMDGSHPTLLYGYGGFSVNMTPTFDPSRLAWLERGGVYAHAILRGGQEYGDAWHRAGMLLHKQNVFDDFIAAAQGLVEAGFTRPERLAIQGRSNGGLLVAACMTQRPDLFGAVHAGVPVIDMLRYHRFTAGRYWVSEYGNADEDAEQFAALLAYAPLQRLRPGTTYPATIVTTADGDDRVVPMHARKFVAALQHADAGRNPLLLRADTRAGHGLGKPMYKVIEEQGDVLAFLWTALHA